MSLIRWWPLISNINDNCGSSGAQCSVATYTTGKVGNCLKLSGGDFKVPNPFINLNSWSIAFWFRDDGSGNWKDFICWSGNKSRLETYATAKQWIWYCEDTTSGKIFNSGTIIQNSTQTNTWNHIVITKQNTAAALYINGVLAVSQNVAVTFTTAAALLHFNSRADSSYGLMSLNDVRCYDHALSLKEIKELSKGLVLHYTFDTPIHQTERFITPDRWQTLVDDSGTNTRGTATRQSDGSVLITSNNQNTRLRLDYHPDVKAGNLYTLSVWYKQVSGNQTFRWQIEEYVSGNIVARHWTQDNQKELVLNDGWKVIYYHFTPTTNCELRIWLQEGADYTLYTQSYYLKNFYLQDGWVNSPTAQYTKIIGDGSGFGNYGALIGDQYTTQIDTINGIHALHSKGGVGSYIATMLNPSFINGTGTLCFWYKKDQSAFNINQGKFLVATPYQTAGGQWFGATDPTPFHNGASAATWYIDGIEKASAHTQDTQWHFYCYTGVNLSSWTSFMLHCHMDESWQYRGLIADFRIYNTILSAADIQELYKTHWATNKSSQLFTRAIQESQSTYQNSQAGVMGCSEVVETGAVSSDYTALEYIQSTGTQYIDTGYIPNHNTTTVVTFSADSYENDHCYIYGAGHGANSTAWELYPWSHTFEFNYGNTLEHKISVPTTNIANTKITTVQRKNTYQVTFNGVTRSGSYSAATFTCPYTMLLFGLGRSTKYPSPAAGKLKIYECTIYDDNTLVRNFIPARRNSDGVLGMYDAANGAFYTNAGSGSFIAGPSALSITRSNKIIATSFNEI